MSPIDLSGLSAFHEEWVALTQDLGVVAHSKNLAELRKKLGESAAKYRYFYVPPAGVGFAGSCQL